MFSKIDWHDLSVNVYMCVSDFSWLATVSNTLDTSASWLKPVFSLSHGEPDIAALITLILKIHWHWELSLTIREEVRKVLKESMYLLMFVMWEVLFVMKVFIK